MTKFSYRTAILSFTRGSTQGRDNKNVAIVKKFFLKHLEIHSKIDIGEKPYLCIHYNQAFFQNSNFKHHLRKNTEEKPYKCSYLENSFNKNIILGYTWEYTMGRSHTYAAILCGKLGNTQERDHTNVAIVENRSHRNFFLRYTYTQWYTLGKKSYICSYCDKAF